NPITSQEETSRFQQEAKAISSLNHPNVATIYDLDEADGQRFLVLEYLPSGTLKSKIKHLQSSGRELSLTQVVDYGLQIAEGLAHAHRHGIIHRDVKTDNMMLTEEGKVKVTDFGLAKLRGGAHVTKTGSTVGTAAYMSPEQARGEAVDHRTDIWSMGVVLYQMITGELPFRGDYEPAIVYSILNEEPQNMNSIRTGVPTQLERITAKAMAKDRNQRYQRVEEMLADLTSLEESTGFESTEKSATTGPRLPSIAVLPFTNMSADKEQEYFCDGMAEEIINALTRVEGLRVVARTSAFAFKGKSEDIREIGRKLDVRTLLEGSVRKAGNRLRITAQLINVADGYHLWSERYDRQMEDVFAIQDDISQAVVNTLRIKLVGERETAFVKRPTENLEAYNLFLKGRFFWSKRTEEGLKKGIQYFQQAIQKDPGFAFAYAGLADSYSLLCSYHILSPNEAIPKARVAATKAMELDNTLAEAYEALAHVRILHDWNWLDAEREFRRAIELNPAYATAHQRYSLYLAVMGQMDAAIAEIGRAQELDPLSLIINTDVGLVFYTAGQYDRAIEQCRQALEIDPSFSVAHFALGLTYEQRGMYEQAIAELQKAITLSGDLTVVKAALGHVYAASGNSGEAKKVLDDLHEVSKRRYVSPYSIAVIYAGLGENDRAVEWLQKSYEERSVWLIHLHLKVDPRLQMLHQDPRFLALLKKMGLEK
ncbi:MAG: protein kinase, partial [Bacteroidota bacterium]